MFRLSSAPFRTDECAALLLDLGAGAVVTFEGRVRSINEGRTVEALEYEAYPALASREGERIVKEGGELFEIARAGAVHRTGLLSVGDLAVWVGVSAPHRDGALAACRYIIDQIKLRVPVWKHERYTNGTSEWVMCTHNAAGRSGVVQTPPCGESGRKSSNEHAHRSI